MTEKAPLTQATLKDMKCGNPDCKEKHEVLFFHQSCHPNSGAWVSYHKADGVLLIECAQCGDSVMRVLVASGLQ